LRVLRLGARGAVQLRRHTRAAGDRIPGRGARRRGALRGAREQCARVGGGPGRSRAVARLRPDAARRARSRPRRPAQPCGPVVVAARPLRGPLDGPVHRVRPRLAAAAAARARHRMGANGWPR
jgi:hypothetical protein